MYYIIYPILYLFSFLPFRVLYLLSDAVYGLVFYVAKYRRSVVLENLAIAFPEKTAAERFRIARRFYHNLIDTFLESVKFISISDRTIHKHSSADFSLINGLLAEGKNVYLMACHQFNWEYVNMLFPPALQAPFLGVYMPIRNKVLDRIFHDFRRKKGTVLIPATAFKENSHGMFDQQYTMGLAADQNPGSPKNAYWLNFFGKPAPFITGPALNAVKNNVAVVMVRFEKLKRGRYHFSSTLFSPAAGELKPEAFVQQYRDEVEKIIRLDPANYLWSHRRWKHSWKPEYGPVLS